MFMLNWLLEKKKKEIEQAPSNDVVNIVSEAPSLEQKNDDAYLCVPKRIQLIYNRTQEALQERVQVILPDPDSEWHARYCDSQKQYFAKVDKVDLRRKDVNELYDKVIKQWISVLYRVELNENETLMQFSQRAAKESSAYAIKLDEFKTSPISKVEHLNESDDHKKIVRNALIEIRQIIESTNWESAACKDKKKINIQGKDKLIPNYAYQIYKRFLNAESSCDTMNLLEQVHKIATDAAKSQAYIRNSIDDDQVFEKRKSATSNFDY